MVGKTKMKDWKAAVRKWQLTQNKGQQQQQKGYVENAVTEDPRIAEYRRFLDGEC
jgi:uncharacterized protein affecting Mg2+/Co2+ transport